MLNGKSEVSSTGDAVRPIQPQYGWQRFLLRYWSLAVLVIILIFAAGIRLRLLDFPLERDEGEYAYMGQLMLHGVPPYQAAYNVKFPGTYAAYALIMAVFGQTVAGIHLGVLLVNAGAIVLVFFITGRWWGAAAGLAAAAAYAIMSHSQNSFGMAGHATHFVVLAMLGGVLMMLKALERDKVWMHTVSGLLLGVSVLMKQPGILFVVMAGLYILWVRLRQSPRQCKRTCLLFGSFALGVALPLIITGLVLWRAGVFGKFWYWTIVYAKAYGSQVPISYGPEMLFAGFVSMAVHTWPLWVLAVVGLILLCFDRKGRWRLPFVLGFTIFSFLAVCPGFYFRGHYFILLMPVVAMLIGGGLCVFRDFMQRWYAPMAWRLPLLIFLGVWGSVLNAESDFLLRMDADIACRTIYGSNPFVESREVGKYLQEQTLPDDQIAVIGSEPQLYFYSQRRSATGYIYMYPLMEAHPYALTMQKEMAAEIEESMPRYIVFVNVEFSWLPRPNSKRYIFDWYDCFCVLYEVVGRVDIFDDESRYVWDAQAAKAEPATENYVLILRRQ